MGLTIRDPRAFRKRLGKWIRLRQFGIGQSQRGITLSGMCSHFPVMLRAPAWSLKLSVDVSMYWLVCTGGHVTCQSLKPVPAYHSGPNLKANTNRHTGTRGIGTIPVPYIPGEMQYRYTGNGINSASREAETRTKSIVTASLDCGSRPKLGIGPPCPPELLSHCVRRIPRSRRCHKPLPPGKTSRPPILSRRPAGLQPLSHPHALAH